MNKRIKELVSQAYIDSTGWEIDPYSGHEVRITSKEFSCEKFAELLIKDVLSYLATEESETKHVYQKYGIEYKERMMLNPSYGDVIHLDEFRNLEMQMFTPDDGAGYWATETHYSRISVWDEKPSWATHVMWFNQ